MRRRLTMVAAPALLAATLLLPAPSALANHENDCAAAIRSGRYNVVSGRGNINGTDRNDVIIGSAQDDRIDGRGGNDIVCGRGGDDRIFGSTGNDVLIGDEADGLNAQRFGPNGQAGSDEIFGGGGNDTLYGDQFSDVLIGEAGNDSLLGGNRADSLEGERGNDFLSGGPNRPDNCDGGPGSDEADTTCEVIRNAREV